MSYGDVVTRPIDGATSAPGPSERLSLGVAARLSRYLPGFGKFGKRGVGYNVDSLVSQIRKILRTAGQHNIALFGAGHLGQAIASSDIFADHGFRVVAIFDTDPAKVGMEIGPLVVRHNGD